MYSEGAPLLAAGQEVGTLHVQVASADSLRTEAVEQRYLGARGDAHCEGGRVWRVGRVGRGSIATCVVHSLTKVSYNACA